MEGQLLKSYTTPSAVQKRDASSFFRYGTIHSGKISIEWRFMFANPFICTLTRSPTAGQPEFTAQVFGMSEKKVGEMGKNVLTRGEKSDIL